MPFLNPKLGIDFSGYIAKYTQDFTGRTWVFETIRDWWADSNGERFFLLTGEPGSGKTTIVARLAQFAQGTETFPGLATGFLQAVHFCSARDSIWIDPKEFARSLALQLAASIPEFGLALKDIGEKTTNITVEQSFGTVQNSDVAGVVIKNLTISGLTGQEAFTQVVVNPLRQIQQDGFSQPVTILVDSLDEALTHDGDSTIVRLLATLSTSVKLRLILTSRNEGKVKEKLIHYKELFLSTPEHLEQNQRDVRDYIHLRLSQEETLRLQAEAGEQDSLMTTLINKSEGNFLYIRFLLDAVVSGQQTFTNPVGLPRGLDELYSASLRRVVELGHKDWSDVYAPVMGVLLAAQASLRQSQIEAMTQLKESVVWNALNDLEQFLDEVESEGGETLYQLYHQSVTDFLGKQQLLIDKKKLKNRYYLPAEEQHQRFVDYYRPEGKPWSEMNLEQMDGYGRRYLAQHLVKAGQAQELHLLLALDKDGKPAWFKLKDDEGDTAGFLTDLELAWAQADEAYDREPGKSIGLQCRYALITASMNSLAAKIPIELIVALIKHNQWKPAKAFAFARQIPDPQMRAKSLTVLAKQLTDSDPLKPSVLESAMQAALSIKDVFFRDIDLNVLADKLPGVREQNMASVRVMEDEGACAKALISLSDQSPELCSKALTAIQSIQFEPSRADALAALAHKLPPDLFPKAMEMVGHIQDAAARVLVLTALADHYPEVLPQALTKAQAIQEEYYRANVLSVLANKLSPELLSQARDLADTIQYKPLLSQVLAALAVKFPEVLPQALTKAEDIKEIKDRQFKSEVQHL